MTLRRGLAGQVGFTRETTWGHAREPGWMDAIIKPPAERIEGWEAAGAGEPMSACPYAPGDPAGAEWRKGWISGESARRAAAGTYGATEEQLAEVRAQTLAEQRPDPVVEILGDYLDDEQRDAFDVLADRALCRACWDAITIHGQITVVGLDARPLGDEGDA